MKGNLSSSMTEIGRNGWSKAFSMFKIEQPKVRTLAIITDGTASLNSAVVYLARQLDQAFRRISV